MVVVVIVFLVAAAALTLGLVFGLRQNDTASLNNTRNNTQNNTRNNTQNNTRNETGSEIVKIFIDNVGFPNGSYVISLSSMDSNSLVQAPAIANSTVLTNVGLVVDPTNDVLVTGRKTFLYILVPPQQATAGKRKRRDSTLSPDPGVCVQFGSSDNCHVVPFSLQYSGLGFRVAGWLSDGSSIYQIPISAPSSMCPSLVNSQCTSVTYQAYVISGNSRSVASSSSSLSAACGSQCQSQQVTCSQTCQNCDGKTVAGTDTPVSRRYHMGRTSGSFQFLYQTYSVPDRIRVFQDDKQIYDSGCLGTILEVTVNITFTGSSDEIRVDVEPNCDGTTSTAWYFQVSCPSPCDGTSSSSNQAKLFSGINEIKTGGTAYIDRDANMPSLVAMYCSQDSSQIVSWTFSLATSGGTNDALCTGSHTLQGTGSRWDIVAAITLNGGWVMGGKATVSWKINDAQAGSISFSILGSQPDRQTVINYITTQVSGNSRLWFTPYVAMHESTQGTLSGPTQFCDKTSGYSLCTSTTDGYPLRAADNGFGIMQLTNPAPTCDQLWNWKKNCDEGVRRLSTLATNAWNWMNSANLNSNGKPTGQRLQARQDTGHDVPVPTDTEANCVFADGTARIIEDAVAMKMYNGATANFCAWDNSNLVWKFNKLNELNFNYVQQVCQLVPA